MRASLVTALLVVGLTATGCEVTTEPKPKTSLAPAAPPATAPQSLPADAKTAQDKSLPAADAAQRPQPREGTPDTALTQKEIRKDMPMPGQANDHSNDAFAKRGDEVQGKSN